ncbi:MAG: hypothetical protein AB4372_23465 [Xenococcus sp. (in: cyanobacteria)]
MPKGRPGGNPNIADHGFKQKYEWDEPCTASIALRLPPSIHKKLKQIPDWQELVRQAIAEIVEEN